MAVLKLWTFTALLLVFALSAKALPRKQKVLVIHSYHQGLNWTDSITAGIQSVFLNQKNVEIHFEYLDTKRNHNPEYMKELLSLYQRKQYNIPFKVVIVSDDNAFNFIRQFRDTYYPSIPVVFCGVNQYTPTLLSGMKNITGVSEEVDFFRTIELMLRLHPQLDTVLVVDDNRSLVAEINRRQTLKAIAALKTKVRFQFLKDETLAQMLDRVAKLKGRKAILLNNYTQDKADNYISFDENIQLIRERAKVPIYSTWNFYLGAGIVGGMLTSGYKQGRLAGELALKILHGSSADSLPVVRQGYNAYEFDYNQLNRFGINLKQLPLGSHVINRPPGFFERHRVSIYSSLILTFLLVGVILLNYVRRKKRESEFTRQNDELERRVKQRTLEVLEANAVLEDQKKQITQQNVELEKHRYHLLELVKERTDNLERAHLLLQASYQRLINMLDAGSEGVWEYNVSTQETLFSDKLWESLGYQQMEAITGSKFINTLIHPHDKEVLRHSLEECARGAKPLLKEVCRILGKDGSYRWFLTRGKFMENGSDGARIFVGTNTDITPQKHAEQQLLDNERVLRASELRWRSLYEQTKEAIVLLDENAEILDCNPAARQLLALDRDIIPVSPFTSYLPSIDRIWPFNTNLDSKAASLEKVEHVLVLPNGAEIPVEVTVSIIVIEDKQVKMLLLRDITERKVAEREVLNAVIEAEERERQRFSKDLHDSIGPLLSALNLYITALSKCGSKERHEQAYALAKETLSETIKSIREISNNLGPQSLSDFGLKVAIKSFVQRLQINESLTITLNMDGLGANRYPAPVEVGLYRIVTELINNTLKHASATEVVIEAFEQIGFLKLAYSDNGKGFSTHEVVGKGGHGLSNISSRIRSINGFVRFWSNEGKGVHVALEVPVLPSASH